MQREGMDPVWLCGFGRSESSDKSANRSQTQAVFKSSIKSGTKGFTGLERIRFTLSEPRRCVRLHMCVSLSVNGAQDVVLVLFLIASLLADYNKAGFVELFLKFSGFLINL